MTNLNFIAVTTTTVSRDYYSFDWPWSIAAIDLFVELKDSVYFRIKTSRSRRLYYLPIRLQLQYWIKGLHIYSIIHRPKLQCSVQITRRISFILVTDHGLPRPSIRDFTTTLLYQKLNIAFTIESACVYMRMRILWVEEVWASIEHHREQRIHPNIYIHNCFIPVETFSYHMWSYASNLPTGPRITVLDPRKHFLIQLRHGLEHLGPGHTVKRIHEFNLISTKSCLCPSRTRISEESAQLRQYHKEQQYMINRGLKVFSYDRDAFVKMFWLCDVLREWKLSIYTYDNKDIYILIWHFQYVLLFVSYFQLSPGVYRVHVRNRIYEISPTIVFWDRYGKWDIKK